MVMRNAALEHFFEAGTLSAGTLFVFLHGSSVARHVCEKYSRKLPHAEECKYKQLVGEARRRKSDNIPEKNRKKAGMIRLLIGENLSPYSETGLNLLQFILDNEIDIIPLQLVFAKGTEDEVWIH
jgi:hypothetical protein